MTLTPEERKRIYEEEKARIESDQKDQTIGVSSTDLKPNVAGLLCYAGFWISGIVMIVLEQKNRLVRFHALQSIILFGAAHLAILMLAAVPFFGGFFGLIIGLPVFILWVMLMVKTYQGELLRIPGAADLAERIVGGLPRDASQNTEGVAQPANPPAGQEAEVSGHGYALAGRPGASRQRSDNSARDAERGRGGRIAASAFAIAWSVALLVFLNFFNDYVAYYHVETVGGVSRWVREPILTNDVALWLPVVTVVLVMTIAAHIMLLAIDKYVVREATLAVLDIFSLVVVATLVALFPFDFEVFGNADLADGLAIGVRLTLVLVTFGIGIGALVRLIKLVVNIARGAATY